MEEIRSEKPKKLKDMKKIIMIVEAAVIIVLLAVIIKQNARLGRYNGYIEDFIEDFENLEKNSYNTDKEDYYKYFHSYSGDYTRGYEAYYRDKAYKKD